jgi:general secretion pathway protein F
MNNFFLKLRAPRMSLKERAFFTKRLSFLIRAGVAIPDALGSLAAPCRSASVRSALRGMGTSVENGKTLAESAEPYPFLFDTFSVEVIRTGELTGSLARNLEYLADELKKRSELRSKVWGAFLYPALIGVFTLCLTVSLILFIFPKIAPIFSGLSVSLPPTTRFLLSVSDHLQRWGLLTALIAFLFAAGITVLVRRSAAAQLARSAVCSGCLLWEAL